jgi:hypothetical protein
MNIQKKQRFNRHISTMVFVQYDLKYTYNRSVYQILDHVYILCALAYLSTGNYTRSIPDIKISIILHGDFIYSEYQQLF